MKKFKFRFETVLELREKELEKAEIKVAAVQMELSKANQALINYRTEQQQNRTALEHILSSGRIDIIQITSYQNYIKHLDNKIHSQHQIIKQLQIKLEKVRQEMLIVRQKKMILDKLKEKDLKEYLKELEYQDIKMLDEIATNKFKKT